MAKTSESVKHIYFWLIMAEPAETQKVHLDLLLRVDEIVTGTSRDEGGPLASSSERTALGSSRCCCCCSVPPTRSSLSSFSVDPSSWERAGWQYSPARRERDKAGRRSTGEKYCTVLDTVLVLHLASLASTE